MLGNDIIDLIKASNDSNWRRKGFLTKLFTAHEQEQILNANCPETAVWLFWSMKEAAYKIVNRQLQRRFFAPHLFQCSANGNLGEVTFDTDTFYTRSEINATLIHTVASTTINNFTKIQSHLLPFMPNYLAVFNSRFPSLNLIKDIYGIPHIADMSGGSNRGASISHHGGHLAIVY